MPSQVNLEAEPIVDDTFEHVEFRVQDEVGEKDIGKDVEGKGKVENPSTIVVDPLVPKKNAKKEKVDVKVEIKTEAKDTIEEVKGKKLIDDPKFIQGPINMDSLPPIQKLQLA